MILGLLLATAPFVGAVGLIAAAVPRLRSQTSAPAPSRPTEPDQMVEAAKLGLPWDAFPWEIEAAKLERERRRAEREAQSQREIQERIDEVKRADAENPVEYVARNGLGEVVFAYSSGPRRAVDTNGDGLPDDRYPPDGSRRRNGRSWRETQALFDESARASQYEVGS